MTDLITWLRAQLDEDERLTRAEIERRAAWQRNLDAMRRAGEIPMTGFIDYDLDGAPGDPRRMLTEVKAKRRLLDEYVTYRDIPDLYDGTWEHGILTGLRIAVEIFATSYEARPGYQPEWTLDASDA